MGKKRKRKAAARRARERPERQQDPRLVAAQVQKIGDEVQPPGVWVLGLSPVDMDDGRRLLWHPPQAVAFNLVEADRHAQRGARIRRNLMGNLEASDTGYRPSNSRAVIDALRDLSAAVLFAFTAVESLANQAIEVLPDDTTVSRRGEEVSKANMARTLGIDDKLKRVVPLLDDGQEIASNAEVWGRYRHLKFLRDELLHVKRRGYDPDPAVRTAYDLLILGDGDECAKDACAVVDAAWPGFLPGHVREALDL